VSRRRHGTCSPASSLTIALGAVIAPAVHAGDLTGHWIGKWSCKSFDGTKFKEGIKPSLLNVTQSGATMGVSIDNFGYNGVVIADDKKPDQKGEAVLISCPTGNALTSAVAEIVRATVRTKVGSSKARFTALSIFADDIGGPEVGTCRYSYKRLDTDDPGVPACP
jgi:hypothetical protein